MTKSGASQKSVEVLFTPEGEHLRVPPGVTLLEAARSAGVDITSP